MVAGFSVSLIALIPIFFRIPLHLKLNDADLQALSQITAALGAFMITIPLFLRDLHKGSIFWRHFFAIAFTLIMATFAGVVSFLFNNSEQEITANFWLVLAFVLSILVNVAQTILGGKNRKRRTGRIKVGAKFDSILSFSVSLLILVASVASAFGDPITVIFILLSLFGFYLTLVLIFAILTQITINLKNSGTADGSPTDYDQQLRLAIAALVNKYPGHAFTQQELLHRLRTESFPQTPQIVSPTRVESLVSLMDADTYTRAI